ncbi:MAG: UPF0758 domain-containing protein, partial [Candidatus Methylomirabilaceae bacterium]
MAVSGRLSVKFLPPHDRPRERLRRCGPEGLSSPELLALLLGTGTRSAGVTDLATQLLAAFGSLEALSLARSDELDRVAGIGPAKASSLLAAFELGRRISTAPPARRSVVRAP